MGTAKKALENIRGESRIIMQVKEGRVKKKEDRRIRKEEEKSREVIRKEKMCGTRLLSATRPSKLINGCQGLPPFCLSPGTAQRQRNPEVKLLNAQHFIQLTFVDSCG